MAPSGMFQMVTYSMDGYLISNITAGPNIVNSKPGNMSYLTIRPSVYQDGQWTNLTFTIIPTNYLQFMTLTIQVPNDMLIAQANPNLCQAITAYSVSKLMTCDFISNSRTIRILNAFTLLSKYEYDLSSTILKQIQITVGQFINPVGQTQSGNFIFTTYDKGGYVIDSWNSSVSYVCSQQCAACDKDDYSKCTACKTNTVYKLLYMGQCVQQCPAGTTETESKCLICPSGCQECSSVNDTCILCKKGLLFLEGSCVLNCPNDYTFKAPASCVKPEIPPVVPTTFLTMFQKTDSYQCFIFPFSSGSIIIAIILWIASCWSQRLVRNKKARLRQQQKNEDEFFLTPIRIVEICIALISFIEVAGWVFFLYCMVHLSEKLPFYVISGALGLNLFLNFIMACGIMRSKENYDRYLQHYSEAYVCTYLLIKFFTLLISHKGFYFSYARYQRDRRRHSHFDFSYFDSGDEDGVSGLCFKFFFLASILLLHGAVIAACVLNYLTNELTHQLFCLDLDIIGMTTFQALLVLLTLLQCGGEQALKVYPGRFGELDENSAYMDVSVPDIAPELKQEQKANAATEQQKLKTSASKIQSKDEIEEEVIDGKRPDSGKLLPKKGKLNQQQDQSQIAILDESGEMPEQDGPAPTLKSSLVNPPASSKKGLQFKEREPMDNNFFEDEQQDKPFKNRQNIGPRQSRTGRNSIDNRISEGDTFEYPKGKGKNKHSQRESLIKKRFEDQEENDDIEEFEDDEEEDPENEDDHAEVLPKSAKKSPLSKGNRYQKKKQSKIQKDQDQSNEEFNDDESDIKSKPKGFKNLKHNKQSHKGKKGNKHEEQSESDEDLSQEGNGDILQQSKSKVKPKKKKKQSTKPKKEKDEEISEESEEVEDISDQQQESSSKQKPKEKKKKISKKKQKKDEIISEEDENESDQESMEQSKTNKSSKKKKKINEKKKPINQKPQGTQYERISHNASSAGDDDIFADQQIPRFMKNNIDKGMQKLDAEIADAEEPSYRNLVDQINHETKQDFYKHNDDQGLKSVYGSIPTQHVEHEEQQNIVQDVGQPVMQPTFQVPSKQSQASTQQIYIQKEPIGEKVQAQYDIINASIPTYHDQQIMEHNGAQFGVIKHSLETHNDQMSMNTKINIGLEEGKSDHSPRKSIQPEFDIMTQIQAKSEKGIIQQKNDEDNISQIIQKLPSQNSQIAPSQASKIQQVNQTRQKIQNDVQNLQNEEQQIAKVELEKHTVISSKSKEIQSNQEIITQPQRDICSQHKNKPVSQKADINIPEKEYSDQEEQEELKDEVNEDDIKPKTKIIFSDKSESSVEEMMEDTPSNYNILNGRLDEDSRGLHSMIYKALSKKILYSNMSGSQHPLPQGNEDHEASKITSKASDRRQSLIGNKEQPMKKEASLFIQDRESTGVNQQNIGGQQNINMRRSLEKHQRNASIEEIRSSKLLNHEEKYDFKNSSEINLALQSINHDI